MGRYKIFRENNILVYTAGGNSEHFAENFYEILRKFAYATSNQVGSSLLYSVEMGVPSFIFGDRSEIINTGDKNMPSGKYDFYKLVGFYEKFDAIFRGFDCEITVEKRKLVEHELGLDAGLNRYKMSVVLYLALIKWIFSAGFVRWSKDLFKKILKKQ
jgi:hypothetical protein